MDQGYTMDSDPTYRYDKSSRNRIDMRDMKSFDDLKEYLAKMSSEEKKNYLID